jgi:glycosyltransferase involved in cell wall biosynthesis
VKVAVVIAARNAAATIGDQLEALAGAEDPPHGWEVIVCENGSIDGTREVAERFSDRLPLRTIAVEGEPSVGRARNAGVAASDAEALIFCDADDVVAPRFVRAMAAALERHEAVGARAEFDLLNDPWTLAPRDDVDGLRILPFPPHLPFASGYGLGVRRARHDEIGGFDESMILDDVDYSIRLQLAGVALHYEAQAIVHYRTRAQLGGIARQGFFYSRDFVLLQKRYSDATAGPAWVWPLKGWRHVFGALPHATTRGGLATLAWRAGWQAGRIAGSVRYRVLAS